jgi:hypothetical protein
MMPLALRVCALQVGVRQGFGLEAMTTDLGAPPLAELCHREHRSTTKTCDSRAWSLAPEESSVEIGGFSAGTSIPRAAGRPLFKPAVTRQ